MVVTDLGTTSTVYDVVFVIEATGNVGAYFESLKSLYISPTLKYFNGGQVEEIDYGCSSNCTLYSLVTFQGSDCAPGQLSVCLEPTTSASLFEQSLDKIDFSSGFGDVASHMSEGLSTTLQLFDDLDFLRDPHTKAQKHCILVCNSSPYAIPSENSVKYNDMTTEQLVSTLAERNIYLSIISPRKIPVLYKLFDLACSDASQTSANAKNYTTDSRHLVLLRGPQLTEQPMSPTVAEVKSEEQVNTVVPPINIKVPQPTGVGAVRNPGSTLPPRPQPPFQPPAIRPAVSVENTVPAATVRPPKPEPHLPQPQPTPIQQPQQRVIWTGTLDWQDKSKPGEPGPRLNHSLHCQITVSPPDDMAVNASNWMNRMNMTLLPSVLLKPFGELFKNSRTVHFQFNQQPQQNSEDLASLYRAMSSGYGGCIHITPVTNTQPSPNDVRVLMLLFSQRKNQFMGLIPSDQTRFVQGIKTVFNKHKQQLQQQQLQQHQMLGSQMPNAAGGSFTGPQAGISSTGHQMSPPMGAINTMMTSATPSAAGGMGGTQQGGDSMNVGLVTPIMAGGQAQHNQQLQQQQLLQQQQQQQQQGLDQDHRNTIFQQALVADQHQRQFMAQQQQLQHQRMQQQQLQQQQLQQQQLQQQTMQSNQPLRHLLQQQQQLRVQHQQQQQQQQQQMLMQQQQLRGRLQGPQQANPQQQGLQQGLNQMGPGQNFGSMPDDSFDFIN